MDFLEKDLEDIIFEAMQKDASQLSEKGFYPFSHDISCLRQVNLSPYGIADLIIVDYERGVVTVIELKKDKVRQEHLFQLTKYMAAVERFVNYTSLGFIVRGILVGRAIENSEWVYCYDYFMPSIDIYTYSYELDGIGFYERSGWYNDSEFDRFVRASDFELDWRKILKWRAK